MRRKKIRGFDLIFHRHKKIFDEETAVRHRAPAGWFADKRGEAGYRYWDGKSWTDFTADELRFGDPRCTES